MRDNVNDYSKAERMWRRIVVFFFIGAIAIIGWAAWILYTLWCTLWKVVA